MKKKNSQLTVTKLNRLHTDKILLIIFFIIYPILFYSYRLVPDDLNELNFIGLTYHSKYFQSIYALIWTFMGKFLPLVMLTLLFIKIRETWTYSMFIPITMYFFQIISLIFEDGVGKPIDNNEIFYIIPFILIYCFFLYRYKQYLNKKKALDEYEKDLVKAGLKSLLSQTRNNNEADG